MKIYLVQHGESVPAEVHPERPLSEQGKQDIKCLAAFLKRAGIQVNKVIHSGKARTRQTAEILAEAMATPGVIEVSTTINPNDRVGAFAEQIPSWDRDTLVAGHLPFMAKLVSRLVTGLEDKTIVSYQPGSLLCLEPNEASGWKIAWMIRPELLR
ncbi:MAG: phosphohistidine phosphatase SixA [Acidobacteria bacterium]|nr:phosphohistidine phosphatase SixA [Acidobacteriota bacterium]